MNIPRNLSTKYINQLRDSFTADITYMFTSQVIIMSQAILKIFITIAKCEYKQSPWILYLTDHFIYRNFLHTKRTS